MPPEIKNFLITGLFGFILLLILIWLVRALIPSASEQARLSKRDKFDLAGYETIGDVRRKEYIFISLSVFVILLCLVIMGGLGYLIISSGFEAAFEEQGGMNILLIFIPAVILLAMVIKASSNYIQTQQHVLQEFRRFKETRDEAIAEHEAKRTGAKSKRREKSAEKKETIKRKTVSEGESKAALRHRKKIAEPKKRRHF